MPYARTAVIVRYSSTWVRHGEKKEEGKKQIACHTPRLALCLVCECVASGVSRTRQLLREAALMGLGRGR